MSFSTAVRIPPSPITPATLVNSSFSRGMGATTSDMVVAVTNTVEPEDGQEHVGLLQHVGEHVEEHPLGLARVDR